MSEFAAFMALGAALWLITVIAAVVLFLMMRSILGAPPKQKRRCILCCHPLPESKWWHMGARYQTCPPSDLDGCRKRYFLERT